MIGVGDAVLTFNYPAIAGMGSVKTALKIPIITDVERSVNVNLTELPTIIYGCRNNFCMDLGATEKVTFKCERINPMPYNDLSSSPEDWSNGKWYRHLEELFDRWQNFGMDGSDVRTGGCQLRFTPADTELMAPIRANVFLVGSLNLNYSIQKMTFSLPLQLATMQTTTGAVETVTLTLKATTPDGKPLTSTTEVLKGFPEVAPVLPDGWAEQMEGKTFVGWHIEGNGDLMVGETYTFSTPATLTAKWRNPKKVEFYQSSTTVTVPAGMTYVTAYAVGGGGGAGGTSHTENDQGFVMWPGGGGGAGAVGVAGRDVSAGDTIEIVIGAGGKGGQNRGPASKRDGGNGGNGGATGVYHKGNILVSASGGEGGRGTIRNSGTGGNGGQQYVAGGTAEHDGNYASPNIASNAGKKGVPETGYSSGSYPRLRRGGAGGAAAAFRYRFALDSGYTEYYESKGGNGWSATDPVTYAGSGSIGGGGGSGEIENLSTPGNGGSGAVILIYFEAV